MEREKERAGGRDHRQRHGEGAREQDRVGRNTLENVGRWGRPLLCRREGPVGRQLCLVSAPGWARMMETLSAHSPPAAPGALRCYFPLPIVPLCPPSPTQWGSGALANTDKSLSEVSTEPASQTSGFISVPFVGWALSVSLFYTWGN